MLAHIDQDNIADYFLVQRFSWAVGNIAQVTFLYNVDTGRSDIIV